MHNPKQILLASRDFAHEQRWRSWWHLGSTMAALAACSAVTFSGLAWYLRLPFSLIAGLLIVRLFIVYHDFEHGTVLRGSKLAKLIMFVYGLVSLNPPSVWKRSHDHHHRHNTRNFGPNIGSFPLLSIEMYQSSTRMERFWYAFSRHPLNFVFGYITVFLLGMVTLPFLVNPKRHFDAVLSLLLHGGGIWLLSGQVDVLLLGWIIPFALSTGLGAYLFYAQHNSPQIMLHQDRDWSHVNAALDSSSYIHMSPLMAWFTGNIGYHHIHHLNAKIPFYRLPEAMEGILDGQRPSAVTTLRPRDIFACLRLKLWDTEKRCLVPWPKTDSSSNSISTETDCVIFKLPSEEPLKKAA